MFRRLLRSIRPLPHRGPRCRCRRFAASNAPMLRRILPWTRERARRICIATLRASRNPPHPVGAACSRTRGRLVLQILSSHRNTSRRRVSSWSLVNGALSPVGPRPSETPPRQEETLCTQVPAVCMHGFWLSGVPEVGAALCRPVYNPSHTPRVCTFLHSRLCRLYRIDQEPARPLVSP